MAETLTAALEQIVEGVVRKVIREEVEAVLANLDGRTTTPDFLTIEEAAKIAKAHPQTVRAWVRSGALKSCRPNRNYLVKRSDLEAFIASPLPDGDATVDEEYERLLSKIKSTTTVDKRRDRAQPGVSKK